MPCAVDYVLEGLARNLELERELGVFALDFDREFLASLPKERSAAKAAPAAVVSRPEAASKPAKRLDFVFLHHAPVTGPGVEMMMKLTAAMKQTAASAPIVFTGEKPAAKIYIVLGMKALRQWYEGVSLAYGGWFGDVDSEVLLVYSPEEIYRFGVKLSPAMVQKKREMWASLQEAMRKVGC